MTRIRVLTAFIFFVCGLLFLAWAALGICAFRGHVGCRWVFAGFSVIAATIIQPSYQKFLDKMFREKQIIRESYV